MFINKVFIYGNLTKDPELKTIPTSGMSVTNVSIATKELGKTNQAQNKMRLNIMMLYFHEKDGKIA